MAIENKHAYKVYLTPEYVDFLRNEYQDEVAAENGLSGLLDAYLKQVVTLLKASKRIPGRKRRPLSWNSLKELMGMKPV